MTTMNKSTLKRIVVVVVVVVVEVFLLDPLTSEFPVPVNGSALDATWQCWERNR